MTKLEELKAAYDAYEAVFDACDAAYDAADSYQTEQMTYDQFRKLHNFRRGDKAALSYTFYQMSLKEPKS